MCFQRPEAFTAALVITPARSQPQSSYPACGTARRGTEGRVAAGAWGLGRKREAGALGGAWSHCAVLPGSRGPSLGLRLPSPLSTSARRPHGAVAQARPSPFSFPLWALPPLPSPQSWACTSQLQALLTAGFHFQSGPLLPSQTPGPSCQPHLMALGPSD